MKLHELRSIRAVVAAGFRVTAAADHANASQPGVSRHLQHVEQALGVKLFERRRHRLVGLTEAGHALLPMINRTLDQIEGMHRVANKFASGELGRLVVATSHTHARYLLPSVVERFIRDFPAVELTLRQGTVAQIAEWLLSGEADLSVSTAPIDPPAGLMFEPIGALHRVLLAPPGHPLLAIPRPSLQDLAHYPLITYGQEYGAYAQITRAFHLAGLEPKIALSTGDTDTIKTYTMCGLGIGIVAHMAFERRKDEGLRAIDARHLFPSSRIVIGLNRERPPSGHAAALIERLHRQAAAQTRRGQPRSSRPVPGGAPRRRGPAAPGA